MDADRARRLTELEQRARRLGELKEHPSWLLLREIFEAKRQRSFAVLMKQLMNGGAQAPPLDQRTLDFERGFWAGANWILENPEQAEKTLQSALNRAERLEGSEG